MFRLVHPRPLLGITAILIALAFWVMVLVFSLERGNNSVPELVILLMVPIGLLVFLFVLLQGPVTWEVDRFVLKKAMGDARTTLTPLASVARVRVRPFLGRDSAILEALDSQGKVDFSLASAEGVSVEDVRAFYEVLAYCLQDRSVIFSSPLGWGAKAPATRERRTTGTWVTPRDLAYGVVFSAAQGGVAILAANVDRVLAYDAFGYSLLIASALGLVGLLSSRKRRRRAV